MSNEVQLDRANDFYYKNLVNSEFCVQEDFDSLFREHLSKEPKEFLNSPKEFDDFAKAYFVYSQDHAQMMYSYKNLDEIKQYLKDEVQNLIKQREYKDKVLDPILSSLFYTETTQSMQILHKLSVMGGKNNDAGFELIDRLINNATEFSRSEIPDPVNQALEFYYDKKIDYTDSSKVKEIDNSIRSYLDDPDLFIDKFNQLSDLEKVEFHEKIENSKGWRGAPFATKKWIDGSYVSNLSELNIPLHAKKVDEWLNSQIAGYLEGNNAISFEHLVYQSLKDHNIHKLDNTKNVIVENKVQNQKNVNKTVVHR